MEIKIISRSLDDAPINAEEIAHLFRIPLFSRQSAMILSAARKKSERASSVGDFDREQARRLKDCGFAGVYHAVRLGEGRDIRIPVGRRLETFQNAQEAGLTPGTCVEPVGSEHTIRKASFGLSMLVEEPIIGTIHPIHPALPTPSVFLIRDRATPRVGDH